MWSGVSVFQEVYKWLINRDQIIDMWRIQRRESWGWVRVLMFTSAASQCPPQLAHLLSVCLYRYRCVWMVVCIFVYIRQCCARLYILIYMFCFECSGNIWGLLSGKILCVWVKWSRVHMFLCECISYNSSFVWNSTKSTRTHICWSLRDRAEIMPGFPCFKLHQPVSTEEQNKMPVETNSFMEI